MNENLVETWFDLNLVRWYGILKWICDCNLNLVEVFVKNVIRNGCNLVYGNGCLVIKMDMNF